MLKILNCFLKADIYQVCEAQQNGYLASVQADEIGMAVVELGGGRLKKGDSD